MNIGFDGSYAILKNNTTEGNYSKIVVDSISECFPKNRIYVYTPYIEKRSTATALAVQGSVNIKQPRNTLSKRLWMNYSGVVEEMNRHHIHLYHGLAGRLPLRINRANCASVVTIHNLAYKLFPEDYERWERQKRAFWTKKSCAKATHIVTTSQSTKDYLTQYLGTSPEKIDVIYPAVDKRFMKTIIDAELETVRNKYKLPQRYILVISSILPHKNVIAVMQAMLQMQDNDVELVIVGGETPYYLNEVRRYAEKHHLMHRLNHIKRAHAVDMPSIYRMAQALVAPSRYEGFGLSVIEAQACSVPTIIASGTSMEEAAGDATLTFEPDDVQLLARHLDSVLADTELRTRLITGGLQNIERFTHMKQATQLIDLYHRILQN